MAGRREMGKKYIISMVENGCISCVNVYLSPVSIWNNMVVTRITTSEKSAEKKDEEDERKNQVHRAPTQLKLKLNNQVGLDTISRGGKKSNFFNLIQFFLIFFITFLLIFNFFTNIENCSIFPLKVYKYGI